MGESIRKTVWYPWARNEFGEVLELLDPQCSESVKSIDVQCKGRLGAIANLVVECTLPLDVETAVGLQILGDRAVADPDLELYILASLEGN